MTGDLADDAFFPYVDFAHDGADYARSRAFWREAFEVALPSEDAEWSEWMADPFDDGHPIFSAIDPTETRAVLLQQTVRSDDVQWFKCWMDRFGDPDGGSPEILMMETFVSRPSRELFQELAHAWCSARCSFESMEELARDVMAAVPDMFEKTEIGWSAGDAPAPEM